MATISVHGVELYYETAGSGDCLVLTHGSWTDGTGWDRVVPRLAERYRVVVWDRRGHSRSGTGAGSGSRAEDAADLAELIEHVGGGPVHVAGNSYGAVVTLTLLTSRPDLVATATVHEPPLWGLLEGTPDQAIVGCARSRGRRPRGRAEAHRFGRPPRRCRALHRARRPGAGHVGPAPPIVPGGDGGERTHLPR